MLDAGGSLHPLPPAIVVGRTPSSYVFEGHQINRETIRHPVAHEQASPQTRVLLTRHKPSVMIARASARPERSGLDVARSLGPTRGAHRVIGSPVVNPTDAMPPTASLNAPNVNGSNADSLNPYTLPFIVDVNRTITIGGPKLMPAVILVQGLKKKGAIDKIFLTFDSPMDRASVTDLHNYDLRNLGRDPQFPYPKGRRMRLVRAADHPATDSIMLTLEKPVTIKDTLSLSLNAKPPSGLRDPNGRYLENAFGPFQVPLMKIYILPCIE